MQRQLSKQFVRQRRLVAQAGERAALSYLQSKGYRLLAKNWRSGRFAEIDLIVCDESGLVVFAEVKTRRQRGFTAGIASVGFEAVNRQKQQKIVTAARSFLSRCGGLERPCRFDVLVVIYAPDANLDCPDGAYIQHISGAF